MWEYIFENIKTGEEVRYRGNNLTEVLRDQDITDLVFKDQVRVGDKQFIPGIDFLKIYGEN